MIATRPDWCISRQRIWGVPIAVFLCERCHEPLNDEAVNRSVVELFEKEGADAWYVHEASALLPAGTACANCDAVMQFRKEMDILDVWFESGAAGTRCWTWSRSFAGRQTSTPRAEISIAGGSTLPC